MSAETPTNDEQTPEPSADEPRQESGVTSLGEEIKILMSVLERLRSRADRPDIPARPPRPHNAAPDDGFPYCVRCLGYRYILNTGLPREDPAFGTTTPCPDCHEGIVGARRAKASRQRVEELASRSALVRFAGKSLDAFASTMMPYQEVAYERARAFAVQPYGFLTLTGPTGTGKTWLAAGVAWYFAEHHGEALYFTTPELLAQIYATFGRSKQWDHEDASVLVTDAIASASLLVLDELGTESGTPDARMRLYDILGRRYDEAKPTVIVSNLSLAHLGEAVPRLVSRLADVRHCVLLVVDGSDRRAGDGMVEGGQRLTPKAKIKPAHRFGDIVICPECGSRPCVRDCGKQTTPEPEREAPS